MLALLYAPWLCSRVPCKFTQGPQLALFQGSSKDVYVGVLCTPLDAALTLIGKSYLLLLLCSWIGFVAD